MTSDKRLKLVEFIGSKGKARGPLDQRMTEAEHNWLIPKFFGNRPSASATEVFGKIIGLVIYLKTPYFLK